MVDKYDYDHVKGFPSYRSVLDNVEFFTNPIEHKDLRGHVYHIEQDGDVIKKVTESEAKCKGKYAYGDSEFTKLCKKINKYLAYYSNHDKLKSKHFEYLNYWLNQKSKGTQNQHIYQNILNHNYSIDTSNNANENKDTYKSKIHTLKSDVYENIGKLDTMNEHYFDFVTKKDSGRYDANKLCEDAKKFVKLYNEEVNKCIPNFENKYCKALLEYRVKYNTQYKFTNRCPNLAYLTTIPGTERYEYYMWRKYEHMAGAVASGTDTLKIIGKVIAVVLGLVFLAKFTPLGSILKGKKGKKKKSSKDEDEGDAGNANGDNEDDSNSQDQSDPLNIFNPNFYSSDNLPPYNEDYNIQYFAAPNYGRTHRR
ncbi:PIR protein [Plasmodium vivax]|uniref:VIR protein n=1 Tax=Plasmodium vivax TaxID=5855 RepID=A0A565A6X6_PLAVI|nr:PIR protein [Plasmodium vivax]